MDYFAEIQDRLLNNQAPKSQILSVGGSPRKGGNSDILLQHVLQGAGEHNTTIEKVQLRDVQFQSCIGCEKCRKEKICTGLQDGMSLLYPKVIDSKGLVLVSPTHNYNITALMKAFIDRLYCFYNFDNQNRPGKWSSQLDDQERKAVLIAVCEQENKKDMGFTLDAMRLPLEALGYEIIGELPVFGVFAKGRVKEKKEILVKASTLGTVLAKSVA
ncbi:MAG: flavodoxin family protein [Thermodesulfobacteriota bacterium]|nr:flavodoxin family protein [Thermodesulfobacteriota bacterium]